MKVTYHAAKRFLERVLHKTGYNHADLMGAKQLLDEMFTSVVPGSYGRPFPLPQYKGFKVVHRDNTVITIISKKSNK
jgi:hypothetical protein